MTRGGLARVEVFCGPPSVRNCCIALKFPCSAARSTCATVDLIIGDWRFAVGDSRLAIRIGDSRLVNCLRSPVYRLPWGSSSMWRRPKDDNHRGPEPEDRRQSSGPRSKTREARLLPQEGKPHHSRGTIALFCEDQLGGARLRIVRLPVVGIVAVNHDDDVGVLLERARLTKVREL